MASQARVGSGRWTGAGAGWENVDERGGNQCGGVAGRIHAGGSEGRAGLWTVKDGRCWVGRGGIWGIFV